MQHKLWIVAGAKEKVYGNTFSLPNHAVVGRALVLLSCLSRRGRKTHTDRTGGTCGLLH